MMMANDRIFRAVSPVSVADGWDAATRAAANVLTVEHFRDESSGHRPRTQLKLLWDDESLHGIFRVEDHYVLAVQTQFNESVCRDSCVEIFIEPGGGSGYCNFEFNCCGTALVYHIEYPELSPGGFRKYRPWTAQEGSLLEIKPSLPGPIPEERVGPCVWTLAFRIPFAPLLACTGAPRPRVGSVWRANVYKCADATSHPHWGSWAPVDALNFHLPRCFGELRFD